MYSLLKLNMIEEILRDVRRQIRSIVCLCEEFGVRHTRAKFTNQNNFSYFCVNARAYRRICLIVAKSPFPRVGERFSFRPIASIK